MSRATAVWLAQNTDLTDQQIGRSCGLHFLELKRLKEGGLQAENPLLNGQLTQEEIDRCLADEKATLVFQSPLQGLKKPGKERKYTPIARRQDRPKAIAWLIKHHPQLSNAQIASLIATTSKTIQAVKNRTHASEDIQPHHPVLLGLCTEKQLHDALDTVSVEKSDPS